MATAPDVKIEGLLDAVRGWVQCGVCGSRHRLKMRGYQNCLYKLTNQLDRAQCHSTTGVDHSFDVNYADNGMMMLKTEVSIAKPHKDRLALVSRRSKSKRWIKSLDGAQAELVASIQEGKWDYETSYDPRILTKCTQDDWVASCSAICMMIQSDPRAQKLQRIKTRYLREVAPGGCLHVAPKERLTPHMEETLPFRATAEAGLEAFNWLVKGWGYRSGRIAAVRWDGDEIIGVLCIIRQSRSGDIESAVAIKRKVVRVLERDEIDNYIEKYDWTRVGETRWSVT